MIDEKGFVFLDDWPRPFWVRLWEGDPWLFRWHPERRWVSVKRLNEIEVVNYALKKLPEHHAELYRRQGNDN